MEEKKVWYKSKTKIGAALVGISAIAGTVGGYLQGSIDPVNAIRALVIEIGVVLAIFGFRDLPLINRK